MALDLFKEIIPSIMKTKRALIKRENAKEFGFGVCNITLRTLSFYEDCLLFANEVNKIPFADPLMKYDFLLNTIRSGQRKFVSQVKPQKSDDLEAVMEYFDFSDSKARDALRVLNPTQIEAIKTKIYKGGIDGQRRKHGRGDA